MKRIVLILVLCLSAPLWAGRSFNGTSDVITVAGNGNAIDITGQAITISTWIYMPTLPGGEANPLGKCALAGQCQYLMIVNSSGHTNNLGFYFRINVSLNHDQFIYCSTTLAANTWYSAVLAIDMSLAGNNTRLYLNGALCISVGVTNSGFITTTGANLLIGKSLNSVGGSTTFFSGIIGETAIWNIGLAPNFALALGKICPEGPSARHMGIPPPVFYSPLWGASGSSIEPDFSGNKLNGTLTGTGVANHPPCTP